ncbi:unnamed protein product [Oppiella nova]|uniref:Synaptosomal-associated protein n=1 Tax=Oppiella nova TaxID=334625 RepID=A0A7R9M1Q5_9ACAR|nr:unnamed protein product [Oppiella nova]CAG2168498.1 unnamed protein product [Oppiella nova]
MPQPVPNRADSAELEELQLKASKTADESLESTRRMLSLCDESNDAGIRTLVALDEQGEQLDRIEKDMDQVNSDMKETEGYFKDMEKFCGVCVCPCGQAKEFKEDPNTWNLSTEMGVVVEGQPKKVMYGQQMAHNGSTSSVSTVGSVSHIKRITGDDREEEMEDNMCQVTSIIGNLRNMAIDIGDEITASNIQIERINQKAESNQNRIQDANVRAQKLLND